MPFDPLSLPPQTWTRPDGYQLSTDRARLDRGRILRYLAQESYWARGMTAETLDRALAGSLPMGLYAPDGALAGFARLVTDYAAFAYLRDVFVLPAHERRGLASWAATVIRDHPELAQVRNWMLATRDAHGVYARAGYVPVPHPGHYMTHRRG